MENSNEVAQTSRGVMEAPSTEELRKFLQVSNDVKNLTDEEVEQFIEISKAFKLNPFKREIYATKYGQNPMTIIIGKDVYVKRAEATGLLDGWKHEFKGSVKDGDLVCYVTIFRKDFKEPFVWEAWYDESVQKTKDGSPNKFWREKPRHMTRKVAISQAFRECFPSDLSGLPYDTAEINNPPEASTTYYKNVRPVNIPEAQDVEQPATSKQLTQKQSDLLDFIDQHPEIKEYDIIKKLRAEINEYDDERIDKKVRPYLDGLIAQIEEAKAKKGTADQELFTETKQ